MKQIRSQRLWCIAALLLGLTGGPWAAEPAPSKSSLGGPLTLADQGSFFVGGRKIHTDFTAAPMADLLKPGDITVDQMYVQYMIPAAVRGAPVVMMHGFNHTGVTFETTPDGREGWATYFVRKGHPVYVVDQPGRGRSGFDPTPLNRAKTTGDASGQPSVPLYPMQSAWINFRFGKDYPVPFRGVQFPLDSLDAYAKQLVPNLEGTLGKPTQAADDLAALLDRIGPAVLIVHSQAGAIGLGAAVQRPDKTLALVDVEGNCIPAVADDVERVFTRFPVLSVFGDNSIGAVGANGNVRRQGCIDTVKAIAAKKGTAEFALLADHGMPGHSHMMMMDKGNLAIADFIIDWLGRHGVKPRD
jgi:pimeloyl-ACP methyl ester carboxylesterase